VKEVLRDCRGWVNEFPPLKFTRAREETELLWRRRDCCLAGRLTANAS